jgi:hypothetical protein
MPINTGSFAKALVPGVNKWIGQAYNEWSTEFTDLFDKETSRRSFEEDVSTSNFGLAALKPEGQPIGYDSAKQGFINRYNHKTYATGFILTEEAMEDNLYDISALGKNEAKALGFALRQTMEVLAANVYNRAFTAGYTYGDGTILCNSVNVLEGGGTFSNVPAVAADLSEAALEQACIDIAGFVDGKGLRISVMPKKLIIPKELMFEAERILKSTLQNDTANNAINALRTTGMFKGGVSVNHYLTDPDAWFIRTNVMNGMKYFERRAVKWGADNDFDSSNLKFKGSFRISFGNSDKRGIYGSAGG